MIRCWVSQVEHEVCARKKGYDDDDNEERQEWENEYYAEKESVDGDMSWMGKKGLELCKSERESCKWQRESKIDE